MHIWSHWLSQSEEISSDLWYFYGGGIIHNEDIMNSFQKFIIISFPATLYGIIRKL